METVTRSVIPFKAKAEGVFVNAPENTDAVISEQNGLWFQIRGWEFSHSSRWFSEPIKLPDGEWRVIACASDLTESQWAEVVESVPMRMLTEGSKASDVIRWKQYPDRGENYLDYILKTATDSGLSLMRSLGITEGNWLVILKR